MENRRHNKAVTEIIAVVEDESDQRTFGPHLPFQSPEPYGPPHTEHMVQHMSKIWRIPKDLELPSGDRFAVNPPPLGKSEIEWRLWAGVAGIRAGLGKTEQASEMELFNTYRRYHSRHLREFCEHFVQESMNHILPRLNTEGPYAFTLVENGDIWTPSLPARLGRCSPGLAEADMADAQRPVRDFQPHRAGSVLQHLDSNGGSASTDSSVTVSSGAPSIVTSDESEASDASDMDRVFQEMNLSQDLLDRFIRKKRSQGLRK